MVQGKVIIIRTTISYGCWAKKGLSLFDKDTISTQENGRMRFSFNDGSLVTLSNMTELEITRSIYDRAAKERSLYFNMRSGKVRFVIRKLDNFRHSKVKIKTKTALVVMVGSDFIIEADNISTRITALKDTNLEVINLATPEAGVTMLSEFKQTIVKKGVVLSKVSTVSKEEVEAMLKEFTFDTLQEVEAPEFKPVFYQYNGFNEKCDEFDELEEKSLSPMDEIFDERYDDKIRGILPQFPDPPG